MNSLFQMKNIFFIKIVIWIIITNQLFLNEMASAMRFQGVLRGGSLSLQASLPVNWCFDWQTLAYTFFTGTIAALVRIKLLGDWFQFSLGDLFVNSWFWDTIKLFVFPTSCFFLELFCLPFRWRSFCSAILNLATSLYGCYLAALNLF